jgi:hypothetical protein
MTVSSTHPHFYVLFDRSGSMESMREAVVDGFNQLLADQQAEGSDARMTIIQFDTNDPHEVIADALPVAELLPWTAAQFVPRGGTPLFDATGAVVTMAASREDQRRHAGEATEDVTIVTITDGHENRSSEFSRAQIVDLVKAKEAGGWSFVFLGAGIDAYGEAAGMGYDSRSVQSWAPDGTGAEVAFSSLSRAMGSKRRKLASEVPIDKGDFFEGDKAAEVDRKRREGGS